MKKILLILSVIFLASCDAVGPTYVEGSSQQVSESEDAKKINYIKDSRTGFCFAERGKSNSYTFTCVPCTEEVERIINAEYKEN